MDWLGLTCVVSLLASLEVCHVFQSQLVLNISLPYTPPFSPSFPHAELYSFDFWCGHSLWQLIQASSVVVQGFKGKGTVARTQNSENTTLPLSIGQVHQRERILSAFSWKSLSTMDVVCVNYNAIHTGHCLSYESCRSCAIQVTALWPTEII